MPHDPLFAPKALVALVEGNGFQRIDHPSKAEIEGAKLIRFLFGQACPSVALREGDTFVLSYDPQRSSLVAFANGLPAYGVSAFVKFRFDDGRPDAISSAPALAFEQSFNGTQMRILGEPYAAPILVKVPLGAIATEIWFKQFSRGDKPPVEVFDSGDQRQNYHFETRLRVD